MPVNLNYILFLPIVNIFFPNFYILLLFCLIISLNTVLGFAGNCIKLIKIQVIQTDKVRFERLFQLYIDAKLPPMQGRPKEKEADAQWKIVRQPLYSYKIIV